MTYSRPWMFLGLACMTAGAMMLCQQSVQPKAAAEPPKADQPARTDQASPADSKQSPTKPAAAESQWKDLFDGKTLTGWKLSDPSSEGKVKVKDGAIVLEMDAGLTAVTWTGEVLRTNYELTLEGMRLEGSDFFCTTTFPVGKDPCTLVVGGWGGGLVGLSNVDSMDASENSTTTIKEFKNHQWYRVRIRVSEAAIEAWIDDKPVVRQPRADHEFDIRFEVESCRPLGIGTWYTTGAVRKIRIRPLSADEIRAAAAESPASGDLE